MKNNIMLVLVLLALFTGVSFGQDLNWWNTTQAYGPSATGGALLPQGLDSWDTASLVQLITGVSIISPTEIGNGVGVGNTLVVWGWVGENGIGDGWIYREGGSLGSLGLTPTDNIFIRVWDRPASTVGGNIPTANNYSGYGLGYMYRDCQLQAVQTELDGPNYKYTIPAIADSSWTFMASAVPEPGTIVLSLLGLGAIISRRFIRK